MISCQDKWIILRLFPRGRAESFQSETPVARSFALHHANVVNDDKLALVTSTSGSPVASLLAVIYAGLVGFLRKLCTPAEWMDMLESVMVLLLFGQRN